MNIRYITVVNNFNALNGVLLKSCGIDNGNTIVIDNTKENKPISYGYNNVIKDILKDPNSRWLAFCHQDFYIGEDLSIGLSKLDIKCIYGPIGISSKGELLGRIIDENGKFIGKIYDECIVETLVETLDAMCMIIHIDTIRKYNLLFDENFKFHLYVEDFCLQAKTKGVVAKILQMNCRHCGYKKFPEFLNPRDISIKGTRSSEFINSRNILIKKWKTVWTTTGLHR